MTFAEIIPFIISNKRVKRETWDNYHAYIGRNNAFVRLYRDTTREDGGEWCPSRRDLKADDWEVIA